MGDQVGTFAKWAQFYAAKILGLQAYASEFVDLLRAEYLQTIVDLHGGGGTFGSVGVSFTYASAKLTIDDTYSGVNGQGNRMTYGPDGGGQPWPLGFEDCPFQDTAATNYHVGALYVSVPARAVVAEDGSINWDAFYDGIGAAYTPDSVADLGGGAGLLFELVTALSAATKWASNSDSRPAVVYKVTPETGSSEAVAVGTVVRTAGPHFRVTISHYFGQDPADPSLTAADYRVIVLGPSFSTATWVGNDVAIELGIVNTGVWSSAGAPLLYVVGDWIVAFQAEHNADGTHSIVTADQVTVAGGADGQAYEYASAFVCEDFDCTPFNGGWQWLTDPAIAVPGYSVGPPPFVDVGTVGGTLDGVFPLPFLQLSKTSGVAAWRIEAVRMRAKCAVGLGSGSLTLKKRERGNDAAAIVDVATVAFTVNGTWHENVIAPAIDVDPTFNYWLHLTITNTAAVLDAEVGDAWVFFKKNAVE